MYSLPLFPLNTVLLPYQPLPLFIFEERYKLMINRCLKENLPFGVVLIRQGSEVGDPNVQFHPVGTSARILHVEPLEEGRMNLLALGEERFTIHKLSLDQPYLQAEVECSQLGAHNMLGALQELRTLRSLVHRYFAFLERVGVIQDDLSQLTLPEDSGKLIYFAAASLQISNLEKQALLESRDFHDLCSEVIRLYRRENAILAQVTA